MISLAPVSASRSHRILWVALGSAVIMAAVFVAILWPKIAHGTLWHHDELLTGNRAREIVVRHDPSTITLNFEPDFTKPPLQYWISSLAMKLTRNRELAVRLPSLLYGALCLPATVLLAWCCRRREADVANLLLPALAVAAFGYFVHISRIGLLDTGTAFYLALALAGCQPAKRNPRWWWLVGAACVLGAWQKAPYAFAAWALVLARRWIVTGERGTLRSGQLVLALIAALLVASAWPALQWLRHGDELLVTAGHKQADTLLRPHDPDDAGFRPYVYWWWLVQDWALVGVLAPVAVLGTLLSPEYRKENPAQVETAMICTALGFVLALTPYRTERYLITIIPLLAVLTLGWVVSVTERLLERPLARGAILGLLVASALPVAVFHYAKPVRGGPEALQACAQDLQNTLRPDEVVVVDLYADLEFNAPDFILFYAHLRRSAQVLHADEIRNRLATAQENQEPTVYRGIVRADLLAVLQRVNAHVQIVTRHGDWVVWKCTPSDR